MYVTAADGQAGCLIVYTTGQFAVGCHFPAQKGCRPLYCMEAVFTVRFYLGSGTSLDLASTVCTIKNVAIR